MPKRIMPLSDIQVKNAKPKDKDYKLSDGYGLHLLVTPTGGKTGRESSNTWGETSLSLRKANPRFRMGTVPGTVS